MKARAEVLWGERVLDEVSRLEHQGSSFYAGEGFGASGAELDGPALPARSEISFSVSRWAREITISSASSYISALTRSKAMSHVMYLLEALDADNVRYPLYLTSSLEVVPVELKEQTPSEISNTANIVAILHWTVGSHLDYTVRLRGRPMWCPRDVYTAALALSRAMAQPKP